MRSHSTDLDLARRIHFVVSAAEYALQLAAPPDVGIEVRLDRVLAGAVDGGLDPASYRACWQLRSHFMTSEGSLPS